MAAASSSLACEEARRATGTCPDGARGEKWDGTEDAAISLTLRVRYLFEGVQNVETDERRDLRTGRHVDDSRPRLSTERDAGGQNQDEGGRQEDRGRDRKRGEDNRRGDEERGEENRQLPHRRRNHRGSEDEASGRLEGQRSGRQRRDYRPHRHPDRNRAQRGRKGGSDAW